jgi:hypothetical protein
LETLETYCISCFEGTANPVGPVMFVVEGGETQEFYEGGVVVETVLEGCSSETETTLGVEGTGCDTLICTCILNDVCFVLDIRIGRVWGIPG